MSSLLNRFAKFSYPAPHALRPAVFFSSTLTLLKSRVGKFVCTRRMTLFVLYCTKFCINYYVYELYELYELYETCTNCTNFPTLVKSKLKQQGFDTELTKLANEFTKIDMELLNVSFRPALKQCDVIPVTEVINFPEEYVRTDIDGNILSRRDFDVDKLEEIIKEQRNKKQQNTESLKVSGSVKTFFDKLHDVVESSSGSIGTAETVTDTLVDDLLRIVALNRWPLKIRNHPLYRLSILSEPYVLADPEFVVDMRKKILVAVEDKHLKNVYSTSNFGETQLTAEILACGNENVREETIDQTIYAVRFISTYVTFYKAVITKEYWEELGVGLPNKQSVIIERWPGENGLKTGIDLADPDGRQSALRALIRIRDDLMT